MRRTGVVAWSPHQPDEFVVAGTDLRLFELKRPTSFSDATDSLSTDVSLPETPTTKLVSTNRFDTELPTKQCVAWHPDSSQSRLLAVALANGDAVLTTFARGFEHSRLVGASGDRLADGDSLASGDEGVPFASSDVTEHPLGGSRSHIVATFSPHHARACNSLAWNPIVTNLLACGLDKVRSDNSLLIWDVTRAGIDVRRGSNEAGKGGRPLHRMWSDDNSGDPTRPYAELSNSEMVTSLCWLPRDARCLIAGMDKRFLRVYDLRDPSTPQSVVSTKAVHGLCFNPFNNHLLASFTESDSMVRIWDTRRFTDAVFSIVDPRGLTQLAWCPTRPGLLASLSRDSTAVQIYDIQDATINDGMNENVHQFGVVSTRTKTLSEKDRPLAAFAWHPTRRNRILIMGAEGLAEDTVVHEQVPLAWSPLDSLAWASSGELVEEKPGANGSGGLLGKVLANQMPSIMRQRAAMGYGMDIQKNLEITKDDPQLYMLWNWLASINKQWTIIRRGAENMYQGVCTALLQGNQEPSQTRNIHGNLKFFPVYRNAQRQTALQLCGWAFDTIAHPIEQTLQALEANGEYEKAAALSLFHLNLHRAIKSLELRADRNPGSDDHLLIMALAGYTDNRNSMWKHMCSRFSSQLNHVYLRAAFNFLTSDGPPFESVLEESGLALDDRIGFACRFLPDEELKTYIEATVAENIQRGDLSGIALTGLTTKAAADLLGRYVDMTGDVQSACLVVAHVYPSLVHDPNDKRFSYWIESYRDILDQWHMWQTRAEFDVARNQRVGSVSVPPQLYVRCGYCFQSAARTQSAVPRSKGRMYSNTANAASIPKVTVCAQCRRTLAKCALCLIPIGTPSNMNPEKDPQQEQPSQTNPITNPTANWFSWCQTCWHGGHADHLADWFADHNVCPVTSCDCECMLRDSLTPGFLPR